MATQEAEYSLDSVVCGHHVYKYIWTPCLGERLSLHTGMGNAHDSYHSFGNKRCEMMDHIPTIICSAMIDVSCNNFSLEASNYTLPVCGSVIEHIRLIKGVSYVIKLCV